MLSNVASTSLSNINTNVQGVALKDDRPGDGSVRVVKSVWYCKHTDIAFLTTSPSQFLFRNGRTDTEEAMPWSYGRSVTCHRDDGTAGPLSFSQILDDDGPDDRSPH